LHQNIKIIKIQLHVRHIFKHFKDSINNVINIIVVSLRGFLCHIQKHKAVKCEGWRSFGHVSIGHESLTALEQWKASRHRSLSNADNRT